MRPRAVVVGEDALDRIMSSLDYRLTPDVEPVTRQQVALVCRAMADHTLIQEALVFDPPNEQEHPWPQATSVGRFLHAVADQGEYE